MYAVHHPGMLHTTQLVHCLCAKLHTGRSVAFQFGAAQIFMFFVQCHVIT